MVGSSKKQSEVWAYSSSTCFGLLACLLNCATLHPSQAAEPAKPAASESASNATAAPDAAKHFDEQIAPLLAKRCLGCHNASDKKGGLDLASRATALAGGESGPAIAPNQPLDSLLWQRVHDGEMPPKEPLPAAERAVLQAWITGGALWGTDPVDLFRYSSDKRAGYDWWALQPVRQVTPPETSSIPDLAHTAIDRFVSAKLTEQGLTPNPAADRRTWLRRVTFDLIGLPPTPEELAAFLADQEPQAFERVVDRLLASPQYGERWARHWLDIVRFGESNGFERDLLRENAWPYRDWVIAALNADLPYDQFARLQLAGDILQPQDPAAVVAAAFLAAGPNDDVGKMQQSQVMKAVVRQDELEDIVSAVGQTFLGLTVNCARCHDHKFDPIRQQEYYQLVASLGGVAVGERGLPKPNLPAEELAKLPANARAVHTAAKIYGVIAQQPELEYVRLRGNPADKGPLVKPAGITSLQGISADFGLAADAPEGERRKKLAEWIASPANPLFARVMVNRLWQFHFGLGLVETSSDFGFNGSRPTHPELLDWLASDFVQHGWSLKHVHRQIVLSATYRQDSRPRPDALQRDADNRWLWRHSRLRLEAEEVRDAMLLISGELNPAAGGPGYRDFTTHVHNSQFYFPADPEGPAFNRRSIYRTWVRSGRNQLLDTLDCPDPSTKTPARAVTTTPLQSLALMNNILVLRQADKLAQRVKREVGEATAAQVEQAFRLIYGRTPETAEAEASQTFVTAHGLPALCRVMFNSNEFLYVE